MLRLATILAAALVGTAPAALAQDYPSGPVTMIVPFAPGGTTDVLARIVAPAMAAHLGQNVLVENVGGAGGRIGTQQVIRAEPDGQVIVFGNMGPLAAAMGVFNDMEYDPRTDLAPVGLVADVPMVLAASKASGVETLEAFVEKLRAEGEAVNFGTAGIGATSDLAPALFLSLTGLSGTRIPYQGAGPAIVDLQAGMMDAVIDQTVTMIPIELGDQGTALAVSGTERQPQIPDVPTFAEAGVPEFDMTVWNAVAAPVGTPEDVIADLAEAIDVALADPDVQARFEQLGVPVPPQEARGPEALKALVASEVDRWQATLADETVAQ